MKYNKLVRDKIPEIIKNKGSNPITHIADDAEYWLKLKEKLTEEVKEFLESEAEEELADIEEVLKTIYEYRNIDPADIETLRKKKSEERGGFKEKIILEES